jgi:DNA uptake protein ComE-like DNA-binding protein
LHVAKLQDELRTEREKSSRTIAKLRSELKNGRRMPNGKLNANTATFEQLRAAGLTVTQTAKLISRREQQGGFPSMASLSRTPGLSDRAREVIRERLSVSRR